jgi:L-fucose isomerase-like protein
VYRNVCFECQGDFQYNQGCVKCGLEAILDSPSSRGEEKYAIMETDCWEILKQMANSVTSVFERICVMITVLRTNADV